MKESEPKLETLEDLQKLKKLLERHREDRFDERAQLDQNGSSTPQDTLNAAINELTSNIDVVENKISKLQDQGTDKT
jgi:hypothetical protein